MSFFPPLVPSSRLYVPGDLPQSRLQSLNGIDASFRRGNRLIGQGLQMSFSNLTESDVILLQQHYIDQEGSFGRFFLSAAVWTGFTRIPVPPINNYAWRYNGPLTVSQASCGRFDVEVELETEPIDLGDLKYDARFAATMPAREYLLDAGVAAAAPARDFILNPGGAR